MKHSRQYRTSVLFSWEIGSKKNHTSRGHFLLLLFFMASHFDKQAYEREVPPKFRWLLQKMVELVISGIHVLAWDELISRDLAPCTLQQSICCLHTQILPEEGPGVNIYWASFVPWKYINRSRSLSKTHAIDISCRLSRPWWWNSSLKECQLPFLACNLWSWLWINILRLQTNHQPSREFFTSSRYLSISSHSSNASAFEAIMSSNKQSKSSPIKASNSASIASPSPTRSSNYSIFLSLSDCSSIVLDSSPIVFGCFEGSSSVFWITGFCSSIYEVWRGFCYVLLFIYHNQLRCETIIDPVQNNVQARCFSMNHPLLARLLPATLQLSYHYCLCRGLS